MISAKVQAAADVFQRAYRFYVKYADGNTDNDMYWHNISADADRIVKEAPCRLTQDLVQAVLSEFVREQKGNNHDALYQNNS